MLKAPRKGPLSTDALRKSLPGGTVRSLGEKGKKVGISSTLPPAVRHLKLAPKRREAVEAPAEDVATFLRDDIPGARGARQGDVSHRPSTVAKPANSSPANRGCVARSERRR